LFDSRLLLSSVNRLFAIKALYLQWKKAMGSQINKRLREAFEQYMRHIALYHWTLVQTKAKTTSSIIELPTNLRNPGDWNAFDPIVLFLRKPSSGMLRRVAHVRTDVSEECIESIIKAIRMGELGMLAVKNAIFWDVTPCGSCKNRRFGGTYRLHHQGDKNRRARNVSSKQCHLQGCYAVALVKPTFRRNFAPPSSR
jgi:hypothetical protein